MPDSLPAKLLLELLQDIPEKLTAAQRLLAQQLSAGPQEKPATSTLSASDASPRPGPLTAAVEGNPASGSFCIRFVRAEGNIQASPPQSAGPDQETLGIAAKVFQLLSVLDPDSRLRKAPPIKVFLLRFRQNLSRAEIAHACGCGTSLVSIRLRAIQRKLPWKPQQLRELWAHVEAMQIGRAHV